MVLSTRPGIQLATKEHVTCHAPYVNLIIADKFQLSDVMTWDTDQLSRNNIAIYQIILQVKWAAHYSYFNTSTPTCIIIAAQTNENDPVERSTAYSPSPITTRAIKLRLVSRVDILSL